MLGSDMNLITTIIGFGMSATFIVFICARLICGRMRRHESRPMFEIDTRVDLEQPEHRITGLQPVVVAAIPTVMFSREAFSSVEDAQCTICLGEYQEKEVLRIMPKCGHSFHLSCIDVWLRKQSTCPVCRLSVDDPFKTKYIRPAEIFPRPINNSPEIPIEHSQLWLLPVADRSEGNVNSSNQGQTEVISENIELVRLGVAESRS